MAPSLVPAAHTSRLRLIVIQALVFSLFATLFVRLYYLQVISGEKYQGQAASQSVREIVVQPARGLIVDDQGRPLVTNRKSWVMSIDRTLLEKLPEDQRQKLLNRVGGVVHERPAKLKRKLLNCGTEGSTPGQCWNGSPFQPVPVAQDVEESAALRILEQPEDFPAVLVEQQSVRSYPEPFGINAAHLLGYLSPITEDEVDQATEDEDRSVNGASVVGRAGIEKAYDVWLRGMPGYRRVAVDSMGRVLGDDSELSSQPGDTLVTSIDAQVQAVAEEQLDLAIKTARSTFDDVTGKNYVADSGAIVVMEAKTGRVVAMANQPTYDPGVWVGGITKKQLNGLYSKKAGQPLLARSMQGTFAPGSTWKPFMSVAALDSGFNQDDTLNCSSGVQVGNRVFKNYESAAAGNITFARAMQISCNSFFYRVGLHYWYKFGSDPEDVNAKDPLVQGAKNFGFGSETGIDIPGESPGRIADREWKLSYYKSMKSYYCEMDRKGNAPSPFLRVFSHEFCLEGNYYRVSDAVNYSIGQGDTIVTPLQLATAYGALANGGTLYEPRVAKAVVSPDGTVLRRIQPKVAAQVDASKASLEYVDTALQGTPKDGTIAWKFGEFPLEQVPVRAKTGSAEVYGKQSTSWVASYTPDYVVVMMVSQAGTGSGTSGPAVRAIYEALYGINGMKVDPDNAAIPGTLPPNHLPNFRRDGSILPPAVDDKDKDKR